MNLGDVGASVAVTAEQTKNVWEKIGENSFYTPQLRFNNMLDAGTIDITGNTKDAFDDFIEDNISEMLSLARNFQNPDSAASQELLNRLNDGEYSPEARAQLDGFINAFRGHGQQLDKLVSSLQEHDQHPDRILVDKNNPVFKAAMRDLRNIFTLYHSTVMADAKEARKKDTTFK